LLLATAAISPVQGQEAAKPERLRAAYFVDSDNDADPESVRTALGQWALGIRANTDDKVTSSVESDGEKWVEGIRNGDHDLYGMFSYQYLELEDEELLIPSLATEGNNGITSTFLLITRRDKAIQSIGDLRGKKIIIDTGGFGELPVIWLTTLIGTEVPAEEFPGFATMVSVQTPARAYLPVYYEKADACVITRSAFKDANALNSELISKLHTGPGFNSKPLLVSLLAFHRDYPRVAAEKIAANARKRAPKPQSQNLFELVGRTGVIEYDRSALETMRELYREYRALFATNHGRKGDGK
jgi:ABC-type phosphate/phosphonate transport system substrate-binding protein